MTRRSDRLFDLIKEGASIRQLQLVLESGVNINVYNERRETPLMMAMLNIHDAVKREQIMKTLILYKANVNCKNLRGQTPLMYACILNQTDIAAMLTNVSWMDCNVRDGEGNTALMYACALGNTDSVKTLVGAYQHGDRKLDVRNRNKEGYAALDFAIDNKDKEAYYLISSLLYRKSYNDSDLSDSSETDSIPDFPTYENSAVCGIINSRHRIKELAVTMTSPRRPQSTTDIDEDMQSDETNISKKPTFSKESIPKKKSILNFSKESIPKKKSILNVHLPTTVDDYVEGVSNTKATVIQPYTDDDSSGVHSNDPVNQPTEDETQDVVQMKNESKKLKRKGKKSIRKRGNLNKDGIEFSNERPIRQEFGEEIMLCNRIYEADPFTFEVSSTPGDLFDQDVARNIIGDLTRKAAKTFNKADAREKTAQIQEFGRFNYLNLTPQDKAKLLGRTIWSAYRTPLPPIPISPARMEQVIRGIQRLRRFLHVAKYKPGRLLKLDPELWCIVESMRHNITTKGTFRYT